MSCDSHRQYLVPSDMAMIERVLAQPYLRQSSDYVALSCGAAKFLIRKFQEGMTEEDALFVALDQYLRTLRGWRSRPHSMDGSTDAQDWQWSGRSVRTTGERQMIAENPVMVISDLLGAANDLRRLTNFERAKLLQRAAACIDDCRKRLDRPNLGAIDLDGCDIAFDLAAMGSAIDLFGAAEIAKVIRRAAATIGELSDEMCPALAEIRVVPSRKNWRVWLALMDWGRRVVGPQRRFSGGEPEARF